MRVSKIVRQLSKFLRKEREKTLSTRQWLEKHRVRPNSVRTSVVDETRVASTEKYLRDRGIDKASVKDVTVETLKIKEVTHRLSARTAVLMSLLIPMSIAPFWLMVLLTLPAFGKNAYSETMQGAFLAALVSDFAGLYHVITRDLFPQGSYVSRPSESKSQQTIDQQNE